MQIHHFLLLKKRGRGTKYISTPPKDNTSTEIVVSCTILKKYLVIIDPLPVNIGVQVTRSAINDPLIIIPGPNVNSVTRYGCTRSKLIMSLSIFRSEFLYLIPCYTIPSDKIIYITTVRAHDTIQGGTVNICVSRYIHIIQKVIIK